MTFASDNFFSQISAKPSSRFLSHQYNSNLFHVGSFLLPSTPCPTSISQNSPNSSWQQEAHESLTWISAYDLQGKDIAYFLTQYWHWIHTQLCFLLKSQADIQCWLSLSNCQVSLVFLVSTGQISTFSSNPAGQLQTHTKLVSCKTITGWLQKINLVSDYQKKNLDAISLFDIEENNYDIEENNSYLLPCRICKYNEVYSFFQLQEDSVQSALAMGTSEPRQASLLEYISFSRVCWFTMSAYLLPRTAF